MVDIAKRLQELTVGTGNTQNRQSVNRFRAAIERELSLNNQALQEFNSNKARREAQTGELTQEYLRLSSRALGDRTIQALTQASDISAPTVAAAELGIQAVRQDRAETAREQLEAVQGINQQRANEELALLRLQNQQSQSTLSQERQLASLSQTEPEDDNQTFLDGLEAAKNFGTTNIDTSVGAGVVPDFSTLTDANGKSYNFDAAQINQLTLAYNTARQSPLYNEQGFGEDYATAFAARLVAESGVNNGVTKTNISDDGEKTTDIGIAQINEANRARLGLPVNVAASPEQEILAAAEFDRLLYQDLLNQTISEDNPSPTLSQLVSAYNVGVTSKTAPAYRQGLPYSGNRDYTENITTVLSPQLRATQIERRPSSVVRELNAPVPTPPEEVVQPPVTSGDAETTVPELTEVQRARLENLSEEDRQRFDSLDREAQLAILNNSEQNDGGNFFSNLGDRIVNAILPEPREVDTSDPTSNIENVTLFPAPDQLSAPLQSIEQDETIQPETVTRVNDDVNLLRPFVQDEGLSQQQLSESIIGDFNTEIARRAFTTQNDIAQIPVTGNPVEDIAAANDAINGGQLEGFEGQSVQLLNIYNDLDSLQDPTLANPEQTILEYSRRLQDAGIN